jgi:hypothetical protein
VNAGNGVRLVSDQPAGDAGAQITAVRYVAVMTQPHGHQGVPQASDLTPGQPGGRRGAAESAAGQRPDDHREGIRRVRAVRAGIRQQRDQLDLLQKRPWPAVGEQQWQRIRPVTPGRAQDATCAPGPRRTADAAGPIGAEARRWRSLDSLQADHAATCWAFPSPSLTPGQNQPGCRPIGPTSSAAPCRRGRCAAR